MEHCNSNKYQNLYKPQVQLIYLNVNLWSRLRNVWTITNVLCSAIGSIHQRQTRDEFKPCWIALSRSVSLTKTSKPFSTAPLPFQNWKRRRTMLSSGPTWTSLPRIITICRSWINSHNENESKNIPIKYVKYQVLSIFSSYVSGSWLCEPSLTWRPCLNTGYII